MRIHSPILPAVFALTALAIGCSDEPASTDDASANVVTGDSPGAKAAADALSDLVGAAADPLTDTDADLGGKSDPLSRLTGEVATLQAGDATFHVYGLRPKDADLYVVDDTTATFAVVHDQRIWVVNTNGGVAWTSSPSGADDALAGARAFASAVSSTSSTASVHPNDVGGQAAEQLAKPVIEALQKAIVAAVQAAAAKATVVAEKAVPIVENALDNAAKVAKDDIVDSAPVKQVRSTLEHVVSEWTGGGSAKIEAVGTKLAPTAAQVALAGAAKAELTGVVADKVLVGPEAQAFIAQIGAGKSRIWVSGLTADAMDPLFMSRLKVWAEDDMVADGASLISNYPGLLKDAAAALKVERILFQSAEAVDAMSKKLSKDAFAQLFGAEKGIVVTSSVTVSTTYEVATEVLFPLFKGTEADGVAVAKALYAEKPVTVVLQDGQQPEEVAAAVEKGITAAVKPQYIPPSQQPHSISYNYYVRDAQRHRCMHYDSFLGWRR